MSCSKWAYEPDVCDNGYCPGECDLCSKRAEALDVKEDKENGCNRD